MTAHMATATRLADAARASGREPVGAVLVDASSNCVVATAQDGRLACGVVPAAGTCVIAGTSHRLAHATMECIHSAATVVRGWKVAPTHEKGAGSGRRVPPQKRKRDSDAGEAPAGEVPPNPSQYLCSGFDLYVTKEPCPMYVPGALAALLPCLTAWVWCGCNTGARWR